MNEITLIYVLLIVICLAALYILFGWLFEEKRIAKQIPNDFVTRYDRIEKERER